MNIFEDLIEELKRENLIEEGVDLTGEESTANNALSNPALEDHNDFSALPPLSSNSASDDEIFLPVDAAAEKDFYRRSAMEEVSSLQMVEHIFSSVEREQMKKIPKTYDSIPVSKALHDFLQVSKKHNSPENAVAEFKLMQETETWFTALSYRDKNILSAQLRRYCETAKPVLSPQALASLARFYRNSPYSESIRSKFDMVITRLFSIEENDERELAFDRQEIVQHLSELYADWSSVSLYDTDDDSEILEIIKTFENFINEAESAESFENLVRSDFFNRLRTYKEQTGVNFYAPSVAATVIACNVRVGNVYVRLLNKERRQTKADILENKYKYLLDQTISEAASKTLKLTALLEEKNTLQDDYEEPAQEIIAEDNPSEVSSSDEQSQQKTFLTTAFQVNKWILGAILLIILFTAGLYLWVGSTEPKITSEGVQELQMDRYYFKDYFKSAKVVNDNLIGTVNPNWNSISKEKKEEVLKNILAVGKEKGFKNVRLQNSEGKTVDYISADNITDTNSNQK